jgi:photosystem II stability/assembly factor-like uncharacterized protein
VLAAGCDKDPASPNVPLLSATVANPQVIGRQEAIRIVFNQPVNPTSVLNAANVVVTNLCTGREIPGSLRISGDTLIFYSPSQAIPFLTPIAVRVQGVLDRLNRSLPQPLIFNRTVEAPPVSDVSWAFLNSPTNDLITGVAFPTRDVGFLSSIAGAIYRTDNGGRIFGAAFKSANVSSTRQLRAFGVDTVFVVGVENNPASPPAHGALLRSGNGGRLFETVATFSGAPQTLTLYRQTGGYVGLIGGRLNGAFAYRVTYANGASTATLQASTGLPGSGFLFTGSDIDTTATYALATVAAFPALTTGALYESSDGGLTFTAAGVPAVPALYGVKFIPGTTKTALVLGDSSFIARYDVGVPGSFTRLGAAEGLPQSSFDPSTQESITYLFQRAYFASPQVGWVVGRITRRVPGSPDRFTGIILMTEDGGHTFRRQAMVGAPNNGLDFQPVEEVFALTPQFAVLGGREGLVAARTAETSGPVNACSFNTPTASGSLASTGVGGGTR